MHRQAGFVEAQLSAGIGKNHQIVVGGFFLEFDLVFFPQFFLRDFFSALYIRELAQKFRDLVAGAVQQVVGIRVGRKSRMARRPEQYHCGEERAHGPHLELTSSPIHC